MARKPAAPQMTTAEMLALCRERAQAVVAQAQANGTWKGVTRGADADEAPVLVGPARP